MALGGIRNISQFNAFMRNLGEVTIPAEGARLHKRIALEALTRIVQRTPVDTGRARGNWQVSIGRPIDSQKDRVDKSGGAAINEGVAALTNLRAGEQIWISNNLPYIEALEGTNAPPHSTQAPEGMVAVTLAELAELKFTG